MMVRCYSLFVHSIYKHLAHLSGAIFHILMIHVVSLGKLKRDLDIVSALERQLR